jgi:hypothetical protein
VGDKVVRVGRIEYQIVLLTPAYSSQTTEVCITMLCKVDIKRWRYVDYSGKDVW